MEEVKINEFIKYYKNSIGYIIIVMLVCLIAGLIYSMYFKVPMYSSTSTIVIATEDGLDGQTSTDITLNQKLVDTYKEIIKSRTVIEDTIENLELSTNYETLHEYISVSSVTNTEVINITVSHENAKVAQDIVTEITKIFSNEVEDLYKIENIKILDKASTASEPYNINLLKDSAIYLGIGFIIMSLLVFIKFYLDNSIKTLEQIENITGFGILGSVPSLIVKGGKYE